MSAVHLAVDGVGAKYGGAATVLSAILEAAIESDLITQVSVFVSPGRTRSFQIPGNDSVRAIECPVVDSSPAHRALWFAWGLSREITKIGADVLLCVSGGGEGPKDVPTATLIQQSLPFSAEAMGTLSVRDKVRINILKQFMRRSCRKSRSTIVQTTAMSESVRRHFKLPQERVVVFEPSVHVPMMSAPKEHLEQLIEAPKGSRILYVGNTSRYKNLAVLVRGITVLRREIPHLKLFATWDASAFGDEQEGVVPVGQLSAAGVWAAYRLADVLVMPSLSETVGLPLIEAMSVGLPVVAADRPYARAVCADAALYFDPHSASALANAVKRVLSDASLRSRLSAAGMRLMQRRTAEQPYRRLIQHLADL